MTEAEVPAVIGCHFETGEPIPEDGFQLLPIPSDVFGADIQKFSRQVVRSVMRLEPARNPLMASVYRVMSRLADERVHASPGALTVGLLLASAKINGDEINTPLRGIALACGVRYSTLLKIRRMAIEELER